MAGSWGCPHEIEDRCTKINNLPCNPGMKGCELFGRYQFADESKNEYYWKKKERTASTLTPTSSDKDKS